MTDKIYLEVLKSNGALISYCDHFPGNTAKYEYIEATQAELAWLNNLEDSVLPAGMVATLSDLLDYRAKAKNIAQLQAKLTQSRVEYGKALLANQKAQTKLDTFLDNAAKERGITRAELLAALEARKSAVESRSITSSTQLPIADDRFKQSIADMFKHPQKYKLPRN
ncbi:hypothetical protein [Pseudomonas capeferrum]|uniref:hypothetical protein n=1 Tax=Pseudomonas capeferrum TaxID=1495066 RepID=UPI0030DDC067